MKFREAIAACIKHIQENGISRFGLAKILKLDFFAENFIIYRTYALLLKVSNKGT